jgi:putative FmdB family regulatory protein
MPTYEFICQKCSNKFALTMKIAQYEKKRVRCPKCNGTKVSQRISSFQTITSKKS